MTTVELGVLEPSDAEKFLLSICPRIDKHAARLAELCGYLPLALRVSASFLKTRPSRSIKDYLKSLTDEINRLSILDNDNENNKGFTASLQLSYDKLEQSHQSMFCQLGVFRGDFDLQAAQTIVMVPGEESGKAHEQEIEEALEEFSSLSLLECDTSTRRYQLNDLVRLFSLSCLDKADEVYRRYVRYYARIAKDIDHLYQQGGVNLTQGLNIFSTERVNINAGWEYIINNTDDYSINILLDDYKNALLNVSKVSPATLHNQDANTAQSLRVFLCHSLDDKPAVRNLYQQLRIDGIVPWFDEENLLPGQNWEDEISKAIRDADVVLVCLSRNSVDRKGFVQKEIKLALDEADLQPADSIFVIPVRLQDCSVPERLSKLHWVNLFAERGYERLMQALQHRANQLGRVITPSEQS
jgi:hypothetical protein